MGLGSPIQAQGIRMRKAHATIGIIAILVIGIGITIVTILTGATSTRLDSDPAKSADTITIKDYTFLPGVLTVKKGTTVTWINNDVASHNAVADDGQPMGGPNGPFIGQGQSYSHTFKTAGVYKYHCSPHPYMHGTVEVTE
jgi:plastocyanin